MSTPVGWLFQSENFMPHGHCFLWQPATLWLNVGADALIAASYLAIPLAIYYFTRQRQSGFRYAWVALMFAAFILLCGATHIMEIVTVWNPLYRVAGALKALTGVVSFATLASLVWIMPRALLLKTPGELNAEVEARTRELHSINAQLRAEIAARDAIEQQLRLAEHERAHADALLQTIVQSAPSLIYAKDRAGRMLLANPPALALIGKPWPEVKGRTDREFLSDPVQAEAVIRNDQRLMEANDTEEFEEAVSTRGGEEHIWFSTKAPLRDSLGTVIGLVGVSVDITDSKRLEHRLRLMVDELNHRVKNTLAIVQALAAQTLRKVDADIYSAFQGRLLGLAGAHDVLTRERWTGADLDEVAVGQLAPSAGPVGGRFELSGPKLRLKSSAAVAWAMILHELASNALKYGAFSNDVGRVKISWEITAGSGSVAAATGSALRLQWLERDGPTVVPPTRRGFGSRLIEYVLSQDLGGVATLQFGEPAGLHCVLEAPLASLVAAADGAAFPLVGHASP